LSGLQSSEEGQVGLPAIPTLEGEHVRLEPLNHSHQEELALACEDGKLYELWYTWVPSPESMSADIDRRLGLYAAGTMMPFATIDKSSGKAIGMTTYMNMKLENFKVEIGSTWLAASYQKTAINPEAKLLMLGYAFSDLNCIAVELRTHEKNSQSRAAIEKLGAKLDGILRNDMIMANRSIRNTAVYSIIKEEWPSVRERLIRRLEKLRN
jgi:RimJ/RimL family protein N-acetyltransferase